MGTYTERLEIRLSPVERQVLDILAAERARTRGAVLRELLHAAAARERADNSAIAETDKSGRSAGDAAEDAA